MPAMFRLTKNLHGRTGSLTVSARVTCRSQSNRANQKITELTSKTMTQADFHGNSASASSKSAVSGKTTQSSRIAPSMSSLSRVDLSRGRLMLLSLRFSLPWKGKSRGKPTTANPKAIADIGTLHEYASLTQQSSRWRTCSLNNENPSLGGVGANGAANDWAGQ